MKKSTGCVQVVKYVFKLNNKNVRKTTMGVILPWIIVDFGQFSSAIALDFKQLYFSQGDKVF